MNTHTNKFIPHVILITVFCLCQFSVNGQKNVKKSQIPQFDSEYIFPFQDLHVHSSSIVDLPDGDLLCCWYEGSGERKANDVLIKAARFNKGTNGWSAPFILADTHGYPDCNPTLFIDKKDRLHLFWIVVQANRWETSVLKWRITSNYLENDTILWDWQDVILLKPREEFAETIKNKFLESGTPGLAWAEYAPLYETMIYEAASDPKKRETGWMTRSHPIQLPSGRILLPLYSDGFNISMMAISDDDGKTWVSGLPIVGRGNVQPSVVRRRDGTLVSYMRDNGDSPGRIMVSYSVDEGYEWSAVESTILPNPGSSVEAIALERGEWIMVYNDTENGRHSLAVSLSDDEGKTWKWTRYLEREDPGKGSYSYPSAIQDKNGIVHISYSFSTREGETIKHAAFNTDWIKSED